MGEGGRGERGKGRVMCIYIYVREREGEGGKGKGRVWLVALTLGCTGARFQARSGLRSAR